MEKGEVVHTVCSNCRKLNGKSEPIYCYKCFDSYQDKQKELEDKLSKAEKTLSAIYDAAENHLKLF